MFASALVLPKDAIYFPQVSFCFLEFPFCFQQVPFCFSKMPYCFPELCSLVFQRCLLFIYGTHIFPRMLFFPADSTFSSSCSYWNVKTNNFMFKKSLLTTKNISSVSLILWRETKSPFSSLLTHLFWSSVTFLYPVKTSENQVFWDSQGV